MQQRAPDVVILGPEWPNRALLRAQLIEDGYDVVALDAWPIPREYRQAETKPRVMIVDLHRLPDPRNVLDELRYVIQPDRVLVVTALGTLAADEIRPLGYHVIARPASVGEIVTAATGLLRTGASASTTYRRE